MESDEYFRAFRRKRQGYLAEWAKLNAQIEAALDELERNRPRPRDAALIEGLSRHRQQLLHEYEQEANNFVDYLLKACFDDDSQ